MKLTNIVYAHFVSILYDYVPYGMGLFRVAYMHNRRTTPLYAGKKGAIVSQFKQ